MEQRNLTPIPKSEAMDHAPLYVSLYIVILAFFILLNTMSTYESKKAEEVVESLKKTFAYQKPDEVIFDPASTEPGGEAVQRLLTVLEEQAEKLIPLDYLTTERGDDRIEITVPRAFLFSGNNAELLQEYEPLLEGFALHMRKSAASLDVTLEMVMDIPVASNFGMMYQAPDSAHIKQAGILARFFTSRNVPASKLKAGLEQATTDDLTLRFIVAPKMIQDTSPSTQAEEVAP